MAAGYVGDVAIAYDRDLGHVLFEPYAPDITTRNGRINPSRARNRGRHGNSHPAIT